MYRFKKTFEFQIALRIDRKKYLKFYNFRLRAKPQRKLFRKANELSNILSSLKINAILAPFAHPAWIRGSYWVLLYRLNFIQRFLRVVDSLGLNGIHYETIPISGKFFSYYTLNDTFKKFHFSFYITCYDLTLLRKYHSWI